MYNADAFAAKLDADANFISLVDRLDNLVKSVIVALKRKKDKTIKQAHHEFAEQFNDFLNRWERMPIDYLNWRMGPLPPDIEALLEEAPPGQSVDTWDDDDDFEFDVDKESGASLVKSMVAYARDHAQFGAVCLIGWPKRTSGLRHEVSTWQSLSAAGKRFPSSLCPNMSPISTRLKDTKGYIGYLMRRFAPIGLVLTQRQFACAAH
jgi:hypothetical protein